MTQKQDKDRFRNGLFFQVMGVIILILGLVLFVFGFPQNRDVSDRYPIMGKVAYVLALTLLAAGVSVYNKGRSLRLRFAEEILARGDPYVLYLRSFASEADTNTIATAPYDTPSLPPLKFRSEEEKLARALRIIGAGIAIGRPDEEWPPLGFSRLYVSHDKWMSEVRRLLPKAQLVVLRVADTKGVLEELKIAREVLSPERLVLMIPHDSNLIREASELDSGLHLLPYGPHGARWQLELTPGLTVPIFRIPASGKVKYSCVGIIYFDSAWVAHGRLLSDIAINFTHALDKSLKPVYKQLGVRTGIRMYQVVFILFVIYMLVVIILVNTVGRK